MSNTPAWSGAFDRGSLEKVVGLPIDDVRGWAFAGSTGAGGAVADQVLVRALALDEPELGGRV